AVRRRSAGGGKRAGREGSTGAPVLLRLPNRPRGSGREWPSAGGTERDRPQSCGGASVLCGPTSAKDSNGTRVGIQPERGKTQVERSVAGERNGSARCVPASWAHSRFANLACLWRS